MLTVACTDSARVASALGASADAITAADLPPGGETSGTLLGLAAAARLAAGSATLVVLPDGAGRSTVQDLRRTLGEDVLLILETGSALFGGASAYEPLYVVDDDPVPGLTRLAELTGVPRTVTPSRAEFGMHAAYGAALRSAALRGGVGAALVDRWGDVVALGTAEVPAYGGGQYWDGDEPDARDFRSGGDPATAVRTDTVRTLLALLADQGGRLPGPIDEVTDGVLRAFDRGEGSYGVGHGGGNAQTFESLGRVVHAEMAALCSAARTGTSTAGLTVYITAAPCRQCLRHLVCAGIERVVYLGPRMAAPPAFHADSVDVSDDATGHVRLVPFTGVGPGAYEGLFGRAPVMAAGSPAPGPARRLATVAQARPEIEAELAGLPTSPRRDELRRLASSVFDGYPRKESLL